MEGQTLAGEVTGVRPSYWLKLDDRRVRPCGGLNIWVWVSGHKHTQLHSDTSLTAACVSSGFKYVCSEFAVVVEHRGRLFITTQRSAAESLQQKCFLNKRITNTFHESQLYETYTASEQRQEPGQRRSQVIEVTKKPTPDTVNESDSANEVQQNEDRNQKTLLKTRLCVWARSDAGSWMNHSSAYVTENSYLF